MKKLFIILSAIVALYFLALLLVANIIGGGSNVYAEVYEFDTSEQGMINIITTYKENHPWSNGFKFDGQHNLNPDYMIYVHLNDSVTYVSYLEQQYSGRTQLKLLSIYTNRDSVSERINIDLKGKKCDFIKRSFELRFLDSLGISYGKKGNPMKIGFIQL